MTEGALHSVGEAMWIGAGIGGPLSLSLSEWGFLQRLGFLLLKAPLHIM